MITGRELIIAMEEVSKEKNLSINEVIEALEDALVVAYFRHKRIDKKDRERLKKFVKAHVDMVTGDVKIVHKVQVVENIEDPLTQITVSTAKRLGFKNASPGKHVELVFDPRNFTRDEVNIVQQVFNQRILNAQKGHKYEYLKSLEGDLVRGRIISSEKAVYKGQPILKVRVDIEGIDTLLPPDEQVRAYKKDNKIIGDTYRRGEWYDFYLKEVKRIGKGKGNFDLIISRRDPKLVALLLEREVPDIGKGIVEIKDIAREPGKRTKVSVLSLDSRIDPVAVCIGPRGRRIKDVQRELRGEKIDIIRWSPEPDEYIRNALAPAEIDDVEIVDPEHKLAKVYVHYTNVKQAIGEEGLNVKLAEKLTGWHIDIVEVGGKADGEGGGLNV